jgi:hypothetical protein
MEGVDTILNIPQKTKSNGVISGDLGSHAVGFALPVHLPGKLFFRDFVTLW